MADGGHTFNKKTFHKPTYCHHCSDMLWGLIGQGQICDGQVCNFVVHERCLSGVITPCTDIAASLVKNPVAHCWSEPSQHKRRFCTVCRKRLDETPALHCMICEYFVHIECQDFAVPDCKENATYIPGKELTSVKHTHHWREGNLPATAKCAYCKKSCGSSECLTGYRCEWCGMTIHGGCRSSIAVDCSFGVLQPIYLPPHAVSIPRTEVPMEAIIGVQIKSKSTPLQRDYSCPELRTIGLCDATDSELSIRHLVAISNNQPEHPCTLLLSPTYQHPSAFQRYRKDSSCESFVMAGRDGSLDDTQSYTNSAVDQNIDDDDDVDDGVGSSYDNNNSSDSDRKPMLRPRPGPNGNDAPVRPLRQHQRAKSAAAGNVIVTENDDGLVRVTFRKQQPKKYHSNLNRIRSDAVMRSRSFQEQGVKPLLRNSRFFVNRHPLPSDQRRMMDMIASDASLDETVSQNIEITVQDEHGRQICGVSTVEAEATATVDGTPTGTWPNDDLDSDVPDNWKCSAAGGSAHILLRLYRRLRHITMGWRRSKCNTLRRARSISEEFSSGEQSRMRDELEYSSTKPDCSGSSHRSDAHKSGDAAASPSSSTGTKREKEERDEETIKVFDGNLSLRRRNFRAVTVSRYCTIEQLLSGALRSMHISRKPDQFYVTDLYAPGSEEVRCPYPMPVSNLHRIEGKRPAIFLRFRDRENDRGTVRVYPGKLQLQEFQEPFVNVEVDNETTVLQLVRRALDQFGLEYDAVEDYRCSEVMLDRGVSERILQWNERPWDIMKQMGKDSIRQMELMRFYLQHKQDPHGPNIALFIGNLPLALSQRTYETIITKHITEENKYTSIGPIYYEYGSVVITFENAAKAVRAFYNLRESVVEDKKLQVLLLPNIEPSMVPEGVQPLLVFVNVKSGGCQGLELISSFRKLLNPYQVFDLDNGGPLPGLYVFRHIKDYKILVCGGDGTIGWVLQCLDIVGQDSECSNPPCAIVPLGTGNDLARVLRWGPGYTGGEDPLNLLRDVIDAEEIRLDRWTVVFHPDEKTDSAEAAAKAPTAVTGATQSEDNSQMLVMNNYFGIGIDADLCLDFHNAREENPNKFNSRLHNKGVYVKMGIRKIVGRKPVKELHKTLRIEVDGKNVELPPVEGIIILNILSWGSGANPWGTDREDHFMTPNHWDGNLEVVGVTGVVHLGQIQSGLRQAVRIAQGTHIKILNSADIPVQVDGEPWIQSPGEVTVFNSALKATMLKKIKSRRRMTEPHIAPAVLSAFMMPPTSGGGSAGENGDRDRDPANT